jgi:hypothetical protein
MDNNQDSEDFDKNVLWERRATLLSGIAPAIGPLSEQSDLRQPLLDIIFAKTFVTPSVFQQVLHYEMTSPNRFSRRWNASEVECDLRSSTNARRARQIDLAALAGGAVVGPRRKAGGLSQFGYGVSAPRFED